MNIISISPGQVINIANLVANATKEQVRFLVAYHWPYEGEFIDHPQDESLEGALKFFREQKQLNSTYTYWIEIRVGHLARFLYPLEDYGPEEAEILKRFTIEL
jgi:hypothetical protein